MDYAGWKASAADRKALEGYIDQLSAMTPANLSRPDQFAFWANLYNAATLRLVLEAYPVDSIRDIKPSLFAIGPWKKDVVRVGGKAMSLDGIEHGVLRKQWRDPRVHLFGQLRLARLPQPAAPRLARIES